MSDYDRKELISLANISHDIGLYNDSFDYMKQVIKMSTPLSCDERWLVYLNHKSMKDHVSKCLDSLKRISIEDHLRLAIKDKIKSKHDRISDEFIELTESYWIKRDDDPEAVIDYKFFKGCSYLEKAFFTLEIYEEDEGKDEGEGDNNVKKAKELFEEAFKLAKKNLSPAHLIRLFIARNLSETYNYMGSPDDLSIAKEAYENGISHLHELDGDLKSKSEFLLDCLKNQIERFSTDDN